MTEDACKSYSINERTLIEHIRLSSNDVGWFPSEGESESGRKKRRRNFPRSENVR